jgi:hypothetical protein
MWIPNLNLAMTVAALGLTTSLPASGVTDKFALGICQTARPNLAAFIAPADSGESFLYQYLQNHSKFKEWTKSGFSQGTGVNLLVPPKHGTLTYLEDRLAVQNNKYQYFPKPGFEGKDHFVMQVEKSGLKVKIYYVIKALDTVEADVGFCPEEFWRISQSADPGKLG